MNKTTLKICYTAVGIALYVVLSMTAKIPVISHISLDLGYVALAVFCYHFGGVTGAIVGGAGCAIISMLTSGWFPPGWFAGNILIGASCGYIYSRKGTTAAFIFNAIFSVIAVAIGIILVKSAIECNLYSIPFAVKLPKNAIAAAMDAGVMILGLFVARLLKLSKAR